MKKLLLIVVIVLSFNVSAQTPQTRHFFIDTVYLVEGVAYTNTYDDLLLYHESDWYLYQTPVDDADQWIVAWYDDTSKDPKVYVYYMQGEIAWKLSVYRDKEAIKYAKELIEPYE